MNYRKVYESIVSPKPHRYKGDGTYYERHHILPKCMGGDNSKENLVLLTAREHFIAHRLLIRVYPKVGKLVSALMACMMFSKGRAQVTTGRKYEAAKIECRKKLSPVMKGAGNPFWGKEHSPESLEKMRAARPSIIGEKNPNYGNKWTEEQKRALSLKKMGQNAGDGNSSKRPEVRVKISAGKMGSLNPMATNWVLKNKKTGEVVSFKGGLKRFLKSYGSTYFALRKGRDKNWEMVS